MTTPSKTHGLYKLKSAVLRTSDEVAGHTKKKNNDWFDENYKDIHYLSTKEMEAHQGHLAQPICPRKESYFSTRWQHPTVNAQRNTERVVEPLSVEDPPMRESRRLYSPLRGSKSGV